MRRSLVRLALLLVATTLFSAATAANAATYLFSLNGPNTATFTLNSSPSPSSTGSNYFDLTNVAATYNGGPATFSNLYFYTSSGDGGLFAQLSGGGGVNLGGAQLFTGTIASPTFSLGTFALSDDGFFSTKYSLTISAAAAVPEPGTWAMMLLGFGAIALTVRRRIATIPQLA
jgi:hypothetical protein